MTRIRIGLLALLLAFSGGGCKQEAAEAGAVSSPEKGTAGLTPAKTEPPTAHRYKNPYTFSEDWFSPRVPKWTELVMPLAGKPLRYLEVGVFEGRSALWMLENVLTHSEAHLVAVDLFSGRLAQTWKANVEAGGFQSKVTTIAGYSQQELRKMEPESFDVIYIDGSHVADDVLADAVLGWQLLRVGGMMIFDDYGWSGYPGAHEPPTPDELRPKIAIDGFVTANRNTIELIDVGFQVFLRKKANPCSFKEGCSPFGAYQYLWWRGQLMKDGQAVELSDKERAVLERYLRSRRFGQVEFSPDEALTGDDDFVELRRRLAF